MPSNNPLVEKKALLLIALLFYGTFFVFSFGFPGFFIADDHHNIVENENLKVTTNDDLWAAIWSNNSGPLGRPISNLTFILHYFLEGEFYPKSFKLANILIHIINGLLLYLVLLKLILYSSKKSNNSGTYLAMLITSLWLLHPQQVNTVLYSVQRMAELAVFFSLLSIYTYITLRINEIRNTNPQFYKSFLVIILLIVLAVFSKESGILAITYILAIEAFIFGFSVQTSFESKRLKLVLIFPLLLVTLFATYIAVFTPEVITSGYRFREFSLYERVMTEFRIIPDYFFQTIFPNISKMRLIYDNLELSHSLFNPVETLLGLLFILFLILLSYLLRIKIPLASLGIAVFLLSHTIESSVLPLMLKYDHRNYFASAGIFIALVTILDSTLNIKPKAKIFLSLFYVGLLALITSIRADSWSTPFKYMDQEYTNFPNSAISNMTLAEVSFQLGNLDLAKKHFYKVIQINPSSIKAHVNLIWIEKKDDISRQKLQSRILDIIKTKTITDDDTLAINNLFKSELSGEIGIEPPFYHKLLMNISNNKNISKKRKQSMYSFAAIFFYDKLNDFNRFNYYSARAIQYSPGDIPNRLNRISRLIKHGDKLSASKEFKILHKYNNYNLLKTEIKSLELLLNPN